MLNWAKDFNPGAVEILIKDSMFVSKALNIGRNSKKPRKDLINADQILKLIDFFFDAQNKPIKPTGRPHRISLPTTSLYYLHGKIFRECEQSLKSCRFDRKLFGDEFYFASASPRLLQAAAATSSGASLQITKSATRLAPAPLHSSSQFLIHLPSLQPYEPKSVIDFPESEPAQSSNIG